MSNESKPKSSFLLKYIIFVIILVLVTLISINYTKKYMDTNMSQGFEVSKGKSSLVEDSKKEAQDSEYAIKSYTETYDTNSLEIVTYYDIDGNVITEQEYYTGQYRVINSSISFVQIDGLKDLDLQNQINARLKQVAYSLDKEKIISSGVTANFSNVLSVVIRSDQTLTETINIDLTTGNDIPFEKLFVSSAPIKAIIARGLYENFAWDKFNEKTEEAEEPVWSYDMKEADTSEIEDEILLAVKKYDELKDKIVYSFSPSAITIHNPELDCTINMAEDASEIAIYKRYLTDENIFKDGDNAIKGLIVFTDDYSNLEEYIKNISYGKIQENIFVEEALYNFSELEDEEEKIVIDYIEKLSEEQKTTLKQETPSDKGVIYQAIYYLSKSDDGYYQINAEYYKTQCSITYFEEQAFKDYIEVKALPRADVGINTFNLYMQEDYPEMEISESEYKQYFLSLTGEFLGNTIEEAESKILYY